MVHTPGEFGRKLGAFAAAQSSDKGITLAAMPVTSHDPAVDLGDKLNEAAHEIGADVIVMVSHTDISVFVVR